MTGEVQDTLGSILADKVEDDVMGQEWPKVRQLLAERISEISRDPKLWEIDDREDDNESKESSKMAGRRDNEQELEFINQALMSETFDKYPPFTIQRLGELVSNPLDHYKSVGKWLRAVEKNITVFSTTHRFASRGATKMESTSSIGSSSFPGSLDLTTTSIQLAPIPWLPENTSGEEEDESLQVSSPATATKRSSSSHDKESISSSDTSPEGEPSPKMLRTK